MRFLRQDYMRYFKLGKKRKKLQKWRRPKGRHSKMRKKRKGYPASPSIGYKKPAKEQDKIKNLTPKIVNNLKDLASAQKYNILVLAKRLGAKKRIEIIKKAEEMKLKILNLGGKNES